MVNTTFPELKETQAPPLPPADLENMQRMRNDLCSSSDFKIQTTQRFLRRVLSPDSPTQSLLMIHGAGQGKCHGINTQILMYDGSIKKIQDVVVGDILMGDDSTPRNVLSLARGRDMMFEIKAVNGDSYTVNSEHILSLKYTGTENIIDVPLNEYLNFSNKQKHNLKGYATAVDFQPASIDFDPYMLGVWLGDGSKRDPLICCQDSVILYYMREFAHKNNLSMNFQSGYDYRFFAFNRNEKNMFLTFLQQNNLIHNKHIPTNYKINSRNVRLQVLAGLIDTGGYLTQGSYEITQKSKQLSDDIVFLARSLGFATRTTHVIKTCNYKGNKVGGYYYRTLITGDVSQIPVKIERKKASPRRQKKDVLKYGFQVIELGEGDYYGFLLDGNHRYVLGNFTVTHNTCTAIQIAEEYIIRPEFQDKRVLVLANPSIQENFRTQLFDISRVDVDADGLILSKQCTGRRYLDMIQRAQAEPLRYTDPLSRQKIMKTAKRLISEFYEFQGYDSFANIIDRKKLSSKSQTALKLWVHETFDNRLIIIDEAHNLRETSETEASKLISIALEYILKTATGITLVLLTATPMYDTFDELIYYLNLFLWNERKQKPTEFVKTSDIFTESGEFKDGAESKFRGWCQNYISYVKGGNPFTFPFRLPPPDNMIAIADRETDIFGERITKQRKYLTLTRSYVSPLQEKVLKNLTVTATINPRLICVFPNDGSFRETFEKVENSYSYKNGIDTFLAPSKVGLYSSKFALVMNTIQSTSGIVFVYSNLVESGAQLFSMCLEEHGYEPAIGTRLLTETSGEIARGSKGKYALFTSNTPDIDISKALLRLRSSSNVNGDDIRVIIASPKVSEGVDFRYVRQIHVLDPWFNMSRIEQVLGRGMRTCSHALLPFKEQNTTVYLHVCRYPKSKQETVDEFMYRTFVEEKGHNIAKVKRYIMESAMDCSLQKNTNELPTEWKNLKVPQIRNQDKKEISLTLDEMSAPTFEDGSPELSCKLIESVEDPYHVRPLSAILDVRDEILDKLLKLFYKKPIWKKDELFESDMMKQYDASTLSYIIQNAIESGFELKDTHGRLGHLESKNGVIAFAIGKNDTMVERLVPQTNDRTFPLSEVPVEDADVSNVSIDISSKYSNIDSHFLNYFSKEIINWYIADTLLTADEKISYMLSLNWENPPIFAKPLKITGTDLYVFGSKKIYTSAGEKITPIGDQETAYREWIENRKAIFIAHKKELFASMKDKDVIFNLDETKTEVMRRVQAKTIGGRMCTTFKEVLLNKFASWLGESIPKEVINKQGRCMFLALAVRNAISKGKDGIIWVTPEEFEIFSEDEHRQDLLKRLKD